MIRYREATFDEWSACPVTGEIFDAKTGKAEQLKICRGRPQFKGIDVHCIIAHTFLGYKPGAIVHHLDHNKMNNMLSNLAYVTRAEHCHMHMLGNAFLLGRKQSEETIRKRAASNTGKTRSEETRRKISLSHMGEKHPMWGKHHSEETKAKMSDAHKGKYNAGHGHPQSEETRRRISASLKARHTHNF